MSMLLALALAAQAPAAAARPASCVEPDEEAVVICGKRESAFRIDPAILEMQRRVAALPPKPPVDATVQPACNPVGPDGCAKGGVIPVSRIALVALRTAVLAATGEDWRSTFRQHEDEYRLYQEAKARRDEERKVRLSLSFKPLPAR